MAPLKIETEQLLELARDTSASGRKALAEIIEDLFNNHSQILSDREKRLMFNIIEKLIQDVEISVRKRLSEKLAHTPDAPLELIKDLANDEIAVAYPVLVHSKVLRDEDLIEIIQMRTEEYHLALTLRDDLNEDVSSALVETNNEDVIVGLLNNENSKISEATLAYLVEQSHRVDTFQEPLLNRQELTDDLAVKMFSWVSDALRDHIVARYELDAQTIDELLRESADEVVHNLPGAQTEGTEKLMASLREAGMINSDMLVKTLNRGEVPLFVGIYCELTELDNLIARRILFGETGERLALACRAVNIPELQFATIFSKTRRVSPIRANATSSDVNKMLEYYRNIDRPAARATLAQWRTEQS